MIELEAKRIVISSKRRTTAPELKSVTVSSLLEERILVFPLLEERLLEFLSKTNITLSCVMQLSDRI